MDHNIKIQKDLTIKLDCGNFHIHGGKGMTTVKNGQQEVVFHTSELDTLVAMLERLKKELE